MLFIFCSFVNDEEIYENKLKLEYDNLKDSSLKTQRNPKNKKFKNESLKDNSKIKEPKDNFIQGVEIATKKNNKIEKNETAETVELFDEDFILKQRKKRNIILPVSIGLCAALVAGLSVKYFCFSKKIEEIKDDNWQKIDRNLDKYLNKLRDCAHEVVINRKDIYYFFIYFYRFASINKVSLEPLKSFNFLPQNLHISLVEEDSNIEKFQQSERRMTNFYWTLKHVYANIFQKNDFTKELNIIKNIPNENGQKNDDLKINFKPTDTTKIKDIIFQLMNIDDSKKHQIWENLERKFAIPEVVSEVKNQPGFFTSFANLFHRQEPKIPVPRKNIPKLEAKDINIIELINNIIITKVFTIICNFPQFTQNNENTQLQNYLNSNMNTILEDLFQAIESIVKSVK